MASSFLVDSELDSQDSQWPMTKVLDMDRNEYPKILSYVYFRSLNDGVENAKYLARIWADVNHKVK